MTEQWMKVEFGNWGEDGSVQHKVTWCNGHNTYEEMVDADQARWLKRALSCGYEKAKQDLKGWLHTPGEM